MALQSDCAHFFVGKPNVYVCLNFALASAYEMLSVEEESMVIMSHVDLVSVLRISRAAGSLGNVQFQ